MRYPNEDGERVPLLAGYQVSVTNCLDALFPEIAAQWHPTLNGTLTPDARDGRGRADLSRWSGR